MLVDTHCHLDFPDFAADLAGVVQRAHEANVKKMITISTRVASFENLQTISQNFPSVFCAVGTHPCNAKEEAEITAEEIANLAKAKKTVAIGECGLDYYHEKESAAVQKKVFLQHIQAARMASLPLVIHSRAADEDMKEILDKEMAKNPFDFILHCYSSGKELAKKGLELGGYVSFSGIVTFKNAEAIREIARSVPLDRLLVETDAPYLAPVPHRGQCNEPAFVHHVAQKIAEIKNISLGEVSSITTQNACRIFKKMGE